MSSITIRGCCIGAGRPKVILPIVASTADGILSEAVRLAAQKADCIEWRADWFPGALDPAALGQVLSGLRAALEEKLLLVTFRTKAEGGEAALTPQQYASFCEAVCASGCADLLDIEFFPNREHLSALIEQAHRAGTAVVCSSHDFHKTPPRTEMVARLTAMQQAGADLPKLAVMPRNARHHHEHGSAGCREPPVRRSLRLGHDLCQPRAGQCARAGSLGCRKWSLGEPAARVTQRDLQV